MGKIKEKTEKEKAELKKILDFFREINQLKTIQAQQDYSFFRYKTLR